MDARRAISAAYGSPEPWTGAARSMSSSAIPLPRTPALLVQHAARALRAGQTVTIRAPRGEVRVLSAEAAGIAARPWPAGTVLVLTDQRLGSLRPPAAGPPAPPRS